MFKHRIVLPDGTIETRTSENRRYPWAIVAVVTEGTRRVQVDKATAALRMAEAGLAPIPVPTPEQRADYADLMRQYEEVYATIVSYSDPNYVENRRARSALSDRKFDHVVYRFDTALTEVERAAKYVEVKRTATLNDFVISYSGTRSNAEKRRTTWQQEYGYAIRVLPTEIKEHVRKARGAAKTAAGTTKSHQAVLSLIPEVSSKVTYDEAVKTSGLTWRAFQRAIRELAKAGMVKCFSEDLKYWITRIA